MATLQQIINTINPTWQYPFEDDADLWGDIAVDKISYNKVGVVADGVEIVCENPRLGFAKALELYPYNAPTIVKGKDVIILRSAIIGNQGFGYERNKDGQLIHIRHFGGVEIHDNVTIGEYVNIHRGVIKNTVIGAGTKIDFGCHIAHGVVLGKNNSFAAHCIIEGSCVIGDNNTFGTNVVVLRKVKVGSGCTIGSGAVVTKDVPDGETWVGNPAIEISKRNKILLDKITISKDDCKAMISNQNRIVESNAKEVPMPIKDFVNGAQDDLGTYKP